ncbi:hypothetical protein AWR36_010495 [Microbulbifer flavimaris]|uniref:DGQHR domain-containing protein n=1 Tax=Microbulbifer flavimaris TaxID=1781068 RepID=A0ABX4HZL6_9GAMM|nr:MULTISPECIES: DNA sulfur modification protein DndB [Microbulbifer]KUJ82963.1 hypothetical protein AVO43_10475 [Microbulbifer sp. ZGT114]PCO05147.1 hypothetical protein AWR36_010495 [Microbulbifer flavimaris]
MAKKKKSKIQSVDTAKYDFSAPGSYFKTNFGYDEDLVEVYSLNIKVSALHRDFKVFEELNNVQDWPISTLIQRELDHKRASQIAHDYLLAKGNTKYFPPLIAVLIPTDDSYIPTDTYDEADSDGLKALSSSVFTPYSYEDEGYQQPDSPVGGIYNIEFDEERGDLVWDRNKVSAVIIDGQHRYKALQEAVAIDKSFNECSLTITLIDLIGICERTDKAPTAVARDLFVTINHTPVEVDESRLVIMDDRDALSTFTQALIDDSNDGFDPVLPPELIDWECEGGKHRSNNSISGVLVIRQVLLSAMFDGAKLSSVDDRINQRNVKKWLKKIDTWLLPDPQIEAQFGKSECLSSLYASAVSDADNDTDDEEESSFLFSYSAKVASLLKNRFKELYLPSIRYVYRNLGPYADLINYAEEHGVLTTHSELNEYYRSFRGRREKLRKDNKSLAKKIDQYEKGFEEISSTNIFYTVMGQKAVFKCLFENFLDRAGYDTQELLDATKEFVELFNDLYEVLCPAKSPLESLFALSFEVSSKSKPIVKSSNVGKEFWRGILKKINGEIDYGKPAVNLLNSIIVDLITSVEDGVSFTFSDREKLISKHEKMLEKQGIIEDYDERSEVAQKVVAFKESIITEKVKVLFE